MAYRRVWLCCALLVAVAAGAVPVAYQLPTDGPLPRTYRVTLAIVETRNPDWVVSQFLAGAPRTVTAENQGRFRDDWNGLDDNFMPVPPGTYGVKGIHMPATQWEVDGEWHSVVPRWLGAADSWAPPPGRDREPLQIHGDPCGAPLGDVDVAPGGLGVVYFQYLENATNNFVVDFAREIGPDQILRSFASGSAAGGPCTCTDGQTIWSWSTDGGRKFLYRADGKPFGNSEGAHRRGVTVLPGWVTALACRRDGERTWVYAAQRNKAIERQRDWWVEGDEPVDRVSIFDGANGKPAGELAVRQPFGLVARGGTLFVLHRGADGVAQISSTPLKDGLPAGALQRVCVLPAEWDPQDLEVDSRGRLYLSDGRAGVVRVLSATGQPLATIGDPGPVTPGGWNPRWLLAPGRLATWVAPDGSDRLLVVENAGPNRLSEWSADGKLLREWIPPQTKANEGYAVDPRNPNLMYVPGQRGWLTRFRVDYTSGQWRIDAVWSGVGEGLGQRLARPRLLYHGDRQYLCFSRDILVYRHDPRTNRWLASTAVRQQRVGNSWQRHLWRDDNGDGEVQEAEWRDRPFACPPGTLRYHGETWQDDFALVAMGQGTRDIWRLPAARFDAHGNPVFERWERVLTDPIFAAVAEGKADALHGANESGSTFNSDWAQCVGSPAAGWFVNARSGYSFSANFGAQIKLSRYVPDVQSGVKLKWRVGRVALQGSPRPGEMTGTIFVTPPDNGLVSVIDQSRAGVHLFTADEGLYVDTLFPEHSQVRGKGGLYPQPGEFFAGYHYLNRENGRIYIAFGKTQPVLFECVGWSATENPVRRLTQHDRTVTIAAHEIATPPDVALMVRGGAGTAKFAQFSPAPGGGPTLDGSLTGWETALPVKFAADARQTVEVRCLYDPQQLYLRWHVRLGRAVVTPELAPAEQLFTHDRGADTVSFYLQGDPAAGVAKDPTGRPGDVRFVGGLFRDGGVVEAALLGLYPPGSAPQPGTPLTYATLVGKAAFAHVGLVAGARLGHALDKDGQGFVLAAALPRAVLPKQLPAFGGRLRTLVNFDANFGGHNRCWWSNADGSASRETYDAPTEARLYPGSWAPAAFLGLEESLLVRNWQILGPFGGPGAERFRADPNGNLPGTNKEMKQAVREFCDAQRYPPDDAPVDLQAAYTGEQLQGYWRPVREVRWRPATVEDLDTRVELGLGAQVYYAATWLHVPAPTTLEFRCQSHPQTYLRWLLNGEDLKGLRYTNATPAVATREVTLRAGWNEVRLRGYCIGYPPFRAGLVIAGSPERLWTLRLSPQPPQN